jgi:hypothetical protein
MTVRAISIIEPVIGPICRGDLCVLWRAGAQVEGLAVGDLLWVREPFYLPREFNRFSPTVARDRGAKVRFAVDLLTAPGPEGYLGTRRMARTLPRAWHRQHLRVTGLEHRELQSITEPEAKAQGYTCRAAFARGWDANLMFNPAKRRWQDNPAVIAFSFDRIEGQVPTHTSREAAHV